MPAPAPSADHARAPVTPDTAFQARQRALFRASVLKQAKWRELSRAVSDTPYQDALDLGSDNGIISLLFRERGGCWTSADLTSETVEAIGRMVGDRVHRLHGSRLPFPDAAFDLIVVVDLLEHLHDDRELLAELARCLRPGGRLVLNVPHLKRGAVLPPLRHRLGLTDAWHGHQHAGYTAQSLRALLPPELVLERSHTYSRFFSHLLDTALNWMYLRGTRGRAVSTAKGMVVTGASAGGRLLAAAYPALRLWAALDHLVPFTEGYMLLATVARVPSTRS